MTEILINGTWHKAPQEVVDELKRHNDMLNDLFDLINEYRMAEQTATAHPTKDARIRAWDLKVKMFNSVPGKSVRQMGMFQ